MAKGIKGLTVQIGGDTGPLDKALSDVNKKSRSLQVELRQVEKLLKLDPTNTELLAQKQSVLSNSVGTTEEKLKALKEAEKQVQAQFEKGEIAEEQYRAFQRELVKTENELKSMKTSLEVATRNLEEFGDNNGVAKEEEEKLTKAIEDKKRALELENQALKEAEKNQKKYAEEVKNAEKTVNDFKEKAKDLAKKTATSMVATNGAIAGTLGYAVKVSDEFDKAFNTLITKTGAAKDEFDSLNTSMENIYKNNFGESIEDVAESMAIVKNNTSLVGDELEEATEQALLMRDVFGFEVNESIRSVDALMKNFNISSNEAFNLIAQGSQQGLDYSGELLDTINEYSVQFSKAGLSAEDMFNILYDGVQTGAWNLDKVGDAVKEFNIRLVDGSKTTSEALSILGLNSNKVAKTMSSGGEAAKKTYTEIIEKLATMDDKQQQNLVGVALFGTMWEDLGPDVIGILGNIGDNFNMTSDSMDRLNNQKYDNIGSALEGLGRTLKTDVIEPVGEELQPIVEEAIEYVKNNAPNIKEIVGQIVKKIGEFVGFIVNNGPTIISLITGIGVAFGTWKVISMINGLVQGINAFKLANKGATTAQALLNKTMILNPFGLFIIAISGLVAGFITLWNTSEGFRNFWIGLWNNIKTFFIDTWNTLVNFFTVTIPTWFENVKKWFSDSWKSICEWTKGAWDNICNFVQVGIMFIGELIKLGFDIITLPFRFIWENCKDIIIETWNFIKNWLFEKWNEISSKVNAIFSPIVTFFTTTWDNIKTNVINKWNDIKNTLSEKWNEIKTKVSDTFNNIKTSISNKWDEVKTNASTKWNEIKGSLIKKWGEIKTNVSDKFNGIKDTISGKWDAIRENASKKWDKIKEVVKKGIDKLKSFFNFTWELPKIKLPHFKVSGKFSLNPPSIPHFGIEWYKSGGIMTKPTMFGLNGSNAMIGGEAGPEAILPISNLRTYIRDEMKNFSIDYDMMTKSFITAIKTTNLDNPQFNFDGNRVTDAILPYIPNKLKQNEILNNRRVGDL